MDFDLFWQMYPRRVAKVAAQKAWAKLTPAEQAAALAALPAHIESWSGRDMEHIPHGSTWLTGKRFEDELTTQPRKPAISDHEFFRIHGYRREREAS